MNNQNAVSKLQFLEKTSFGAGDAACNMLFMPITMFLSFFYTDIFGLTPAVVATMFLVERFADAIFDPIYGAFIDKTKSRYGRYRPWIALMTIPFVASCMLMFYTPDLSPTAKIIYAFATYLLLSLLYSGVNIPYCSLGGVITADPNDRVACQKYRFVGAGLAGIFCTVTMLPLVNFFGADDSGEVNRQIGFFYVISIFAVIAMVLFAMCFFFTKERIYPKEEQKGLIDNFKTIVHNDQWFVSTSLMFLDCLPSFIRGAASIYFAKYVLGFGDAAATAFLTVGLICNVGGASVTSFLTNRFDKVAVYKWVKFICMFLSLLFLVIPSNQVVLIYVLFIVLSFIHQICAPLVWSFIGDVDDYGEWKLHQRASALCASGHLFTLKLALAVGGALVGLVLSISGYEANALNQTDSAMDGIYALMSWIPAIGYLLNFLVTHYLFKLNRQMMQKINQDLYGKESAV